MRCLYLVFKKGCDAKPAGRRLRSWSLASKSDSNSYLQAFRRRRQCGATPDDPLSDSSTCDGFQEQPTATSHLRTPKCREYIVHAEAGSSRSLPVPFRPDPVLADATRKPWRSFLSASSPWPQVFQRTARTTADRSPMRTYTARQDSP